MVGIMFSSSLLPSNNAQASELSSYDKSNMTSFNKVVANKITPPTEEITFNAIEKDNDDVSKVNDLLDVYSNRGLKEVTSTDSAKSDIVSQLTDNANTISIAIEVQYQLEFNEDQEKVKNLAHDYFSKTLNKIVGEAKQLGYVMNFDLDSEEFRDYIKSIWLSDDPQIIELNKFIDIYENYYNNKKINELASTLSAKVYNSFTELNQSGTFGENNYTLFISSVQLLEVGKTFIRNMI